MFSNNRFMFFLMFLAMITWGIAWTSAKIVNEYLEYNNLVFLRFFVGFLCMIPFLYHKKLCLSNISFSTLINISITSFLFFLYNQCFFIGTDIGQSGMGGVFVTSTNPVITFFIVSIISKKFSFINMFFIGIGAFGGFLILDVFNQGFDAFLSAGNRYFILCSIFWGILTIFVSSGQKKIDSIWYIALCYLVTSFISLFFINPTEILDFSVYDMRFFLNFFFVCSAMSFGTSIYIMVSHKIGPVSASTFIFSVPFIAMATAYIFIDEPLSINTIVGGLLGVFSTYLINYVRV